MNMSTWAGKLQRGPIDFLKQIKEVVVNLTEEENHFDLHFKV